jgi:hypothetical protein
VTIAGASIYAEQLALPLLLSLYIRDRKRAGRLTRAKALSVSGVLLLAWILVAILSSSVNAPDPGRSYHILAVISFSAAGFFLVRTSAEQTAKRVALALTVVASIFAISICAWALAEYGSLDSTLVVLNYGESVHRIKGLMIEPNLFGSLGALWIALAFYWRRSLSRGVLRITLPIIAVGVFLTFTRAAWVAIAFTALLAVFRGRHLIIRLPLLIGAGALLAFLIPQTGVFASLDLGATFTQRVSGIFNFDSGTGAYRVTYWDIAWQQMVHYGQWAIGLGTNSFSQRTAAADTSTGTAYLGNFWLAQLYDTGVLGLACVIGVFALVWVSSRNRGDASAVIVTLAVTAAVTNPMWFVYPWIALAFISVPRYDDNATTPHFVELADRKNRTFAMATDSRRPGGQTT